MKIYFGMVAKTHIALGRVSLVFLYTGRKRQVSDPHISCSARNKPTREVPNLRMDHVYSIKFPLSGLRVIQEFYEGFLARVFSITCM